MKQLRSHRLLALFCAWGILLGLLSPLQSLPVSAAGVSIQTTLENNALQRGSKKTFDVIARDGSGKKLASSVTLNGSGVGKNWDDTDKTSYTLTFTKGGANTVVVSAGGKSVTYTITYQKAGKGDVIGQAAFSIELFTLGGGYLVAPTMVDIKEGETSATALLRLLHQNGYVGFYGGSPQKAFYLAYIADGAKSESNYNGYQNSRSVMGAPSSPKSLNLTTSIPAVLYPYLERTMDWFDDTDYENNWTGYLGEFVCSNGSGWMYSVNNVFPNVGFADTYLSDGDVVRVQFTLGYGADIGGASAMGGSIPGASNQPTGNYFSVANKDRLTALAARAKSGGVAGKSDVSSAYRSALSKLQAVNASQSSVDSAYQTLNSAVSKYLTPPDVPETPSTPETPGSSGGSGNSSSGNSGSGGSSAGSGNSGSHSGSGSGAAETPSAGDPVGEDPAPLPEAPGDATEDPTLPGDPAADPDGGNGEGQPDSSGEQPEEEAAAPVQSPSTLGIWVILGAAVLCLAGLAGYQYFYHTHHHYKKKKKENTHHETNETHTTVQ